MYGDEIRENSQGATEREKYEQREKERERERERERVWVTRGGGEESE